MPAALHQRPMILASTTFARGEQRRRCRGACSRASWFPQRPGLSGSRAGSGERLDLASRRPITIACAGGSTLEADDVAQLGYEVRVVRELELQLKPGRCGNHEPRLQAPRHDDAVRRARRGRGKIIGRCMQRRRHQEFIRFLNAIEAEVPVGKIAHVVLDKLRHAQAPKGPCLGSSAIPALPSTTTDLGLLAQCRRGLLRQAHQTAPEAWRLPIDSSISRPPLTASSLRPMTIRSPSPGPPTPEEIIAAVRRGHQMLDSIH